MPIAIDRMTGKVMLMKATSSGSASMADIANTSAMTGTTLKDVLDTLKNTGQDLTFVEGKGPVVKYAGDSYRITMTAAGVLGIEGPL